MSAVLRAVPSEGVDSLLPSLIVLLVDAVGAGASLGFHAPLDPLEAAAYWRTVAADLATGSRLLVVAEADGQLVGCGQLAGRAGRMLHDQPAGRATFPASLPGDHQSH